jgi:hypothetical protein
MRLFIIFKRRSWYRKKRFAIPICLATFLSVAAIILGSILGTRSNISPSGMTFDILFSWTASDSSFYRNWLLHCTYIQMTMLPLYFHLFIVRSFPNLFSFLRKYSCISNLGRTWERNIGKIFLFNLRKQMIFKTRKHFLV